MKRKRLVIGLIVLGVFVLFLPFTTKRNSTLALSASDSLENCQSSFRTRLAGIGVDGAVADEIMANNKAVLRGCERCADENENRNGKGVAWINSDPNDKIITTGDVDVQLNTENMFSTIAASTTSGGEVTVYFHGIIYGCGNGADAMNYDGVELHVLDGPCHPGYSTDKEPNCGQRSNSVKWAFLANHNKEYINNVSDLAGSELGRFSDGGSVGSYKWSLPGKKIAVKIDMDKFTNYVETHLNEPDVSKEEITNQQGDVVRYIYQDKIYVYRCPKVVDDNGVNGRVSSSCGTDESIIRISVPVDIPKPKTCSEKYPNKTSVNRPSWWSGAPFEYNECGGTSVLASQVKVGNTSSVVTSESGSSEATLYVKPGATVEFDHFYLSASQKATNTEITVNGTTNAARYFVNGNGNWRNGHYVTNSINGGDATGHGWTNNGGSNVGTVDHFNLTNYYDITKGPGGNSHSGANNEHGVLRTGSQVSQRNVGDVTNPRDITINENLDGVTSNHSAVTTVAVSAVVPYNYVNTAEAAIPNNNSRIYVGETARIDGTFRTKGKTNGRVVGGDSAYATVSPNTSYRLYSYYSDRSDGSDKNCLAGSAGCDLQINVANIKTNSDETPDGSANNVYWHASPTKTINIPDISLGTTGKYLCVTAAIYPANSGDDTSLNPNGNDQWDSQTKCAQLAKKPTFQIRGGNLYTAGSITVNTSTKNNLDNNSVTGTFAFGPWIEHGIIAGKTNEAASGAALGYTGNSNGVLRYDYNFGASASSICKYQPITVANNNCYSGSSAGNAGNSGVRVAASDTVNLDDYMDTARTKGKHVGNSADGVDLSDSSNYIEVNGVRYTYANSGLSIKATGSLPSGTTHVIFATGAVAIVGNLQYNSTNNGAGYTKASEIPQYIVISNSNINIGYSVTRVDAWLIAKNGTIDTCKEGSTVGDESECAKQLRINGPIVAKDLELDRAYGAATGAYSAVPAEVINVSPATYIFSQAKANESTSLRTVYSKEVAPRW